MAAIDDLDPVGSHHPQVRRMHQTSGAERPSRRLIVQAIESNSMQAQVKRLKKSVLRALVARLPLRDQSRDFLVDHTDAI